MKKDKQDYKIITIAGGDVAVSYLPEIKGTAAVVDLATLVRITKGLRAWKFTEIRDSFCMQLAESQSMDQFIGMLGQELAFHITCNKIAVTDLNLAAEAIAQAEETDKERESVHIG